MLAKRRSKSQVTLPKASVQRVGEADFYDVMVQGGKIVLAPVRLQKADATRSVADVFRIRWREGGLDLAGPADTPPELVAGWV